MQPSQAFCKKWCFTISWFWIWSLRHRKTILVRLFSGMEASIDRFEVCRFISLHDGDHETSFVNYLAALSISSMLKSSLAKKTSFSKSERDKKKSSSDRKSTCFYFMTQPSSIKYFYESQTKRKLKKTGFNPIFSPSPVSLFSSKPFWQNEPKENIYGFREGKKSMIEKNLLALMGCQS